LDPSQRETWIRLSKKVQLFCAPIWWERERSVVLANATMTLVETSTTVFGVTNDHVVRIYESDLATHSDVFCQLGSGPLDPLLPNLIDRSEAWDLATFRLPTETLAHLGSGRTPFNDPEWPPGLTGPTDQILMGGFPETLRSQSPGPRPEQLHLGFFWVSKASENASDTHISFRIAADEWESVDDGSRLPPDFDLSGVSGGPCFRLVPAENRIEIAGFVYEAESRSGIVRVRQASLISADGTIAVPPIGWTSPSQRPRR